MSIVVQCQCGKNLKLKDEAAGRRVRCPACETKIDVPAAEPSDGLALKEEVTQPGCPSCGKPLRPGAVLCVMCGYDLRTGRRAGELQPAVATTEASPGGRYPRMGLSLVYWGTRFGFGLVIAGVGLGLFVTGFWLGDQPGVQLWQMGLLMILGVIYAGIGIQVSAKGGRLDWFQADEDELSLEESLIARGAPALSGMMVLMVWATGRLDILFLLVLPVGMLICLAAVALGVVTCLARSSGGKQKLIALGSALAYVSGGMFLVTATKFAFSLGLSVLSLALGEVLFLLWLRELGRQLDFEAAVVHVVRLLLFVAMGGGVVMVLALVLSSSLQEAFAFPPVFTVLAFSFYLIAALYAAAATMWRLRIMQALMEEIETLQAGT